MSTIFNLILTGCVLVLSTIGLSYIWTNFEQAKSNNEQEPSVDHKDLVYYKDIETVKAILPLIGSIINQNSVVNHRTPKPLIIRTTLKTDIPQSSTVGQLRFGHINYRDE